MLDKQRAEVTFEVTIVHYVHTGDPNPDEAGDIERPLYDVLKSRGFDLQYVIAKRV